MLMIWKCHLVGGGGLGISGAVVGEGASCVWCSLRSCKCAMVVVVKNIKGMKIERMSERRIKFIRL